MKEHEQHLSPESIDQLTERSFSGLPAQDSRLIADLYQTYAPFKEENDRSLQRIWSRFVQAEGHEIYIQEGQRQPANRLGTPVPGSFQQPSQPLSRRPRRLFWRRLGSVVAVAIVLFSVLSAILLTHSFLTESPQTTLGASLTLDGG